jgi:hypothetical protein
METPLYTEQQRFPIWAYATLAFSEVVVIGAILWATSIGELETAQMAIILVVALFMTSLIGTLLFLRTVLTPGQLTIQLGMLPLLRKVIPLEGVAAARVVTYNPIRDCGGWGWRWGRFEGQRCTFLNARGNRGVLLSTRDGHIVVGSQEPEALLDHLKALIPILREDA